MEKHLQETIANVQARHSGDGDKWPTSVCFEDQVFIIWCGTGIGVKNDFHFFYLRTVGLEFGFAEMEKSVRIRGMKLGLKMNEKYI